MGTAFLMRNRLQDTLCDRFLVTTETNNSSVNIWTNGGVKDWGDGTVDNADSHTYRLAGTYIVRSGTLLSEHSTDDHRIKSVLIDENHIGRGSFYDCIDLTYACIVGDPTSIPDRLFTYAAIPYFNFKKGLLRIGDGSFASTELRKIDLPSTLVYIGDGAFSVCTQLSSPVDFPRGITKISDYAFSECSFSLLNLPATVDEVGVHSFGLNTALRAASMRGVKYIRRTAFSGCSSLATIYLSNELLEIENYAFDGCTSLFDIFFSGTKAQWNAVTKGLYWDIGTGYNYTVHCDDGDILLPTINI